MLVYIFYHKNARQLIVKLARIIKPHREAYPQDDNSIPIGALSRSFPK